MIMQWRPEGSQALSFELQSVHSTLGNVKLVFCHWRDSSSMQLHRRTSLQGSTALPRAIYTFQRSKGMKGKRVLTQSSRSFFPRSSPISLAKPSPEISEVGREVGGRRGKAQLEIPKVTVHPTRNMTIYFLNSKVPQTVTYTTNFITALEKKKIKRGEQHANRTHLLLTHIPISNI